MLLYDVKLINGYTPMITEDSCEFIIGNLTWEGHEFLDKIRSDTVWNNTKKTIIEKGLPMVLDVIKEVASAIVIGMTQTALKGI